MFLCAALLLPAVTPSITAYACECGNIPIVYVLGRSVIYKTTDDWSDENKAEGNVSGGAGSVLEAAAHVLPLLNLGLLTGNWDPYCDAMFDELVPVYDQYALNEDGEIDNVSGLHPDQQTQFLIDSVRANGEQYHILQTIRRTLLRYSEI